MKHRFKDAHPLTSSARNDIGQPLDTDADFPNIPGMTTITGTGIGGGGSDGIGSGQMGDNTDTQGNPCAMATNDDAEHQGQGQMTQ